MPDLNIATRREFLTRGLGLIGVGTALPDFLIRTALAGPDAQRDQRVLVIMQMDGGNDTLNTIVPHGHPEYHTYRREATRLKPEEILKFNDELGFHHHIAGWKQMLDEGMFACVHAVGYPNPNFSHFESTNIWMIGDTRGKQVPYGWIGRACEAGFPDSRDEKLAVAIGPNNGAALALRGPRHAGILCDKPEAFGYAGGNADAYRKLNTPGAGAMSGELQWITRTAVTANAAADEIGKLAKIYKPRVEYPDTPYGRNLRTIAGLIAGGLSTRIYWTGRDGRLEFDTHSNQRPKHDNLLKELNDALLAFFADLKQQGQDERVLLMTVSEFGRTAKENGNKGTDHAAAAAQFVFGRGVKPGFHGKHPSLKPDDLLPTGTAMKFATDFRSVYATVLEKWLRIPSGPVLGSYPLLDFIA